LLLSLLIAQAEYEEECELAQEEHAADLLKVQAFNQEIWPKVQVGARVHGGAFVGGERVRMRLCGRASRFSCHNVSCVCTCPLVCSNVCASKCARSRVMFVAGGWGGSAGLTSNAPPQIARLALAELARVAAFAEHLRFCANKFSLGINLMPNTPNYDRVVEMQVGVWGGGMHWSTVHIDSKLFTYP
jgi:hypothetical protein